MTTLAKFQPSTLPHFRSGKVREVFDAGENLVIVATDRISAFDHILPDPIPGKGALLTQISNFWFQFFHDIPNHLVSTDPEAFPAAFQAYAAELRGRSVLARKAQPLPVECVVRGHIAGSGWKEYQTSRSICGIALPPGLQLADALPEPIFTPTTKADAGHDMPITWEECVEIIGEEAANKVRSTSLAIFRRAAEHLAARGIILADTKFEFGHHDGGIILIDEVLTPDSSRFWPAESVVPGSNPPSYDKQFVRDYLESLNWDKEPPVPQLPPEIIERTAQKYREALDLIISP